MKKICSLFFAVALLSVIYAQDFSPTIAPLYTGPNWGTIVDTGITCTGGPNLSVVRDDGTYENGYQAITTGDSSSFVQKMVLPSNPFTITQICVVWTRTAAGTVNRVHDLIVYDTLGAGGAPGNLITRIVGVTSNNIAIYPLHTRHSFTVNIPGLMNRAYYVGVRLNNNPTQQAYFSADENGTNQGPGYWRTTTTYPAVWEALPNATFASWRNFGIRLEGTAGSSNYMGTWPTPGVNTNYIAIPHQASMVGFGNNITIEAWIRPGVTTSPNTVLNKGAASFDYQLGVNTGGLPFFRAGGTIATGTVPLVAGVWSHLAVTSNGSQVIFYVNAVPGPPVTSAATLGSSSNEMRLGRGNADPCSGNLEEVRLWSVVRTQGAIDSNKCRKFPAQFNSSAGLKAIWHLDNNAVDSVSSYNGTVMGNVTYTEIAYPLPGVNCNLVAVEPVGNIIPNIYELKQNYPNPFNPSTSIQFSIPQSGMVELKVFDLLGREVATLVQDPYEAGTYSVSFDASKLSSGVYFYTITSGSFTDSKKMLLVK